MSSPSGLSTTEAHEILKRDGPNALPQDGKRRWPRIVVDALREPMLQLLLAAGLIYLVIGDRAEALILLAFAVLNVGLVVLQESRTEHALAALKDLTGANALVIRDGTRTQIAATDLVVGDLMVVTEGDRIPADARLLESTHLEMDESSLTGESLPVGKHEGDTSPFVWSGTLVVAGTGLARVTSTGLRTQIGRIGTSLSVVEPAPTPLQTQIKRLVKIFAVLGFGASAFLALAYGLLHGAYRKAKC